MGGGREAFCGEGPGGGGCGDERGDAVGIPGKEPERAILEAGL